MEDASTTPIPIARGPPMYKNFSLGAHTANVESPEKEEGINVS